MPVGWSSLLSLAPLLGPAGWTLFGVTPPDRDVVVFDPVDCGVRVAHVDLDGGAAHRELRVARVWSGGRWRTSGIESLATLQAGGAPTRISDVEAWIEARVDGDESRGVNQDGVEVRWRWDGGRLLGYTDPSGMRTTYTYAGDGGLVSISWPDGAGVQLAPGRITGAFGAWSCQRDGDRTTVTDPSGGMWRHERTGDETVLTDPGGAAWRTRVVAGELAGWTDAAGRQARLQRDLDGRASELVVGSDRWSLPGGARTVLATPGGARWTLELDPNGRLVRLADAVGRLTAVERDPQGRVRSVWAGGASRIIGRDRFGRVVSEQLPGSLRVEAVRDGRGRVARITDPSGAAWTITRDPGGAVVGLTDPVGGTWVITRDRAGQVQTITDPTLAVLRVERRSDGRITRVEVGGGGRWDLMRGADGRLSAIKDPLGRRTGWLRDGIGRVTSVLRPDGSSVGLQRDAVGEVIGLADLTVDRDASGRPRAVRQRDGREVRWEWDAAGRLAAVTGPGLSLGLDRGADGSIGGVRVRGSEPWTLRRDGGGQVIAVDGPGAVRLRRDGGGRVVEVDAGDGRVLKIDRDLRGLTARVRGAGGEWKFRRDAVGRLVGVSAGRGVDVGVDRDGAGRPTVVRFGEGWLARYTYEGAQTTIRLQDGEGGAAGVARWVEDATGRMVRRTADADWVYRRDPLGALAAMESAVGAWSRAPDRVEGPGGYDARLTTAGRPASVSLGDEGPSPYGLAGRAVTYSLGDAGEVAAVVAGSARVALSYDGLGRIAAVGKEGVVRDALGGLQGVGALALVGYEGLLQVAAEARAYVPEVAWCRRGGGLLLDGVQVPILSVFLGPLGVSPTGFVAATAVAETGAGGRLQLPNGGPLLGRLDAVDPYTGQTLGPAWEWPWASDAWEVGPGLSPWADPDDHADGLWWDPGPFAPSFPDPLSLLAQAGELPDAGPGGVVPPGLPWMPLSFAPDRPAGVPDPGWVTLDDDPLVELVWRRAHAPVAPLEAEDVARSLFGPALAAEMQSGPGLAPELPTALRP